MQIDEKVFVAIDYKLTLASGEEVDSSPEGEPFGFITGVGQVVPGLEKGLMGKTAGDQATIVIEPEDGYGEVNDAMVQDIPRTQFPEDVELEPGMTFHAQGPHGPVMLSVKEMKDADTVIVDLNHPLAGQQLHFDVTVTEVREPSTEELAALAQHAQQAGGGCGCGSEEAEPSQCGSGCNCG